MLIVRDLKIFLWWLGSFIMSVELEVNTTLLLEQNNGDVFWCLTHSFQRDWLAIWMCEYAQVTIMGTRKNEEKKQMCEKDLDPNFVLLPELNSCLDTYITTASASCNMLHFFSSVYICSCMFMGVDAWACLCACQRLALTVFLNHSVPCALKQGLLVNMDIIKLGTLVDQKVSGTSCVCLPVTGKTDTHRSAWYFTWTLWVWTQGFVLTWQALYILSHLLSPQSFYIIQKC